MSLFGVTSAPEVVPVPNTVEAEVVQVIDGDTIDVLLNGEKARVRYIGIDTPEVYPEYECFGREAKKANQDLVTGKLVILVSGQEDKDKYDRLLRYVYAGEVFVNEELLKTGMAFAMPVPPNIKYAKDFYKLQKEAKAYGFGLWSTCDY